MTKKHFQALAATLKSQHDWLNESMPTTEWYAQWSGTVRLIADVCAKYNSNFNRARFYAACGMETL